MTLRVTIDATRCQAHGMCALVFGERIDLDRWGFAVAFPDDVPERLATRARRAAAACPRGAVVLVETADAPGT